MASDSNDDFDLIILGGGLAGASLALALRDSNRRIALVEGHPPAASPPDGSWDTRVYAISPASIRFLRKIGLWDALDWARIAPIYDMRVAGDAGGSIHFSAYESGVESLSQIAESSLLSQELWRQLKHQPNLEIIAPAEPTELWLGDPEQPVTLARLHLQNGRQLAAPLIVGADGRESWTRKAARLRESVHPYEELGVVANFATEHPHRGTAWQWFRDDGVLAWLPLPGRTISMVWSAPLKHAETLLALSPEALAETVAVAGNHAFGQLTPLSRAIGFPLKLITVAATVKRHCALIGDAAHGIHPLSGHGVNLGFSDAAELSARILAAPDGQSIGDIGFLSAFAKTRRTETFLLQQGTHVLHQLFRDQPFSLPGLPGLGSLPSLPAPPGLSLLRNIGLTVTDRLSPVKSWLARVAMG